MFNQKLKVLRKQNHLTQEDLAVVLGLKRTTITQYEAGKIAPSKDVLIKIANYFRVSLDELVGNDKIITNELDEQRPPALQFQSNGSGDFDSVRMLISQKIVGELFRKSNDEFIRDHKNLFLKLIDAVIELNMRSLETEHALIRVSFGDEDFNCNQIIEESAQELNNLKRLTSLLK